MTTALFEEQQKPSTSGYIELFQLDTTTIGGTQILYFTPTTNSTSEVVWGGNTYTPFPIEFSGVQYTNTTSAPSKPTLKVSNAHHLLVGMIISLGDLCGAQLTRYRTFVRFLDGQPDADSTAHFPPDVFLIDQKQAHNKTNIQFSLTSIVDRPNLLLPLRQVLTDGDFPGADRSGSR